MFSFGRDILDLSDSTLDDLIVPIAFSLSLHWSHHYFLLRYNFNLYCFSRLNAPFDRRSPEHLKIRQIDILLPDRSQIDWNILDYSLNFFCLWFVPNNLKIIQINGILRQIMVYIDLERLEMRQINLYTAQGIKFSVNFLDNVLYNDLISLLIPILIRQVM